MIAAAILICCVGIGIGSGKILASAWTPAEQQITLTVWLKADPEQAGMEKEGMEAMIEAYQHFHNNIRIEVQCLETEEYLRKFNEAVVSGKGPDIYECLPDTSQMNQTAYPLKELYKDVEKGVYGQLLQVYGETTRSNVPLSCMEADNLSVPIQFDNCLGINASASRMNRRWAEHFLKYLLGQQAQEIFCIDYKNGCPVNEEAEAVYFSVYRQNEGLEKEIVKYCSEEKE